MAGSSGVPAGNYVAIKVSYFRLVADCGAVRSDEGARARRAEDGPNEPVVLPERVFGPNYESRTPPPNLYVPQQY